ncbi:MAG TPA: carboxypeptidase regulatory-like domain-containing protein [Pyrinomonadaceae bacterium]|nr:carboxypeptidase regulatory-like domain-containing protein [Pyrinomonadaceae bacterium]
MEDFTVICKRILLLSTSILMVGLLVLNASAQQNATASLSGVVKDANGAVLTGAQITATQNTTGVRREATSNGDGFFVITNLASGSYELKVRANGFADQTVPVINLQVGQTFNLEVPMSVTVQETVTLDHRFNYELVNSTTPVVDGVIRGFEIESLPLNGRNFLELALLIPGNAPAPNFDPTKTNTIVISSAGQLGRGGNVTVDGADDNDDVVGGQVQNISQEAVQEFQIATNRFSAQLGRSGSSVINIVTKSGSNEYHGSGSIYFRDKKLQGLPATFNRGLGETPPFDREQYAFTLGGPIRRDRAWFFGSIEYRNQDGATLVGSRDLATRTIRRTFAEAPLNDLLSTERFDWHPRDQDHLFFRYSLQREDDVSPSTLDRAIGSASQRQAGTNNTHSFLANYTRVLNARKVNSFNFSLSTFSNNIEPVTPGPQLTFPSIQDGASFRVPQSTKQRRLQFTDTLSMVRGNHTLSLGGEIQRVDADFDLRVFQTGRIELIEDFPDFDRNNDGRVDDNDLLFAVTLRSGKPTEPLLIPNADSTYFAAFVQDDWRVHPQLMLNLGLRYELDTDVKNVSRIDELNPIILPFLRGKRGRDTNNFGPRIGFNYASKDGRASLHGGYGIYYDRITLEIQSLERGLDGRALPIEVRAGNVFFIPPQFLFDPVNGRFPPGAPTLANPFTGFILPGAGAGGINIIDNTMQNPMVQQMNLGIQWEFANDYVLRADYLHNFGTHFIIGRSIGTVFNPVVGGPDSVVNLESSVKTKYDGLLMSVEKRFSNHYQFRASYTLSKAFNFANDDQIPFSNGPLNPNNLQLEYGPTPNDQRHRFTFSGIMELPAGFRVAPIFTLASGVPMDILVPGGGQRIPQLQRNAGGRLFKNGAQLNAFINQVNAAGGFGGEPLPLVSDNARFNDKFNSVDLRLSKVFKIGEHLRIEPLVEAFNLFNVTNVLGFSKSNYSGFSNVLVRDSNDPTSAGFLRSSSFGRPVTTAGGVFGSGGPRAFQFAARVTF